MIFNMVGGGGGSGATLVVSSPVNVSVTVSKDDKSYTKNSGSLGSTTFKGLATGTWTVTISGNGQTATRTIEITADYAITIAFFSATINITYPANSTCIVTNSSGQTVASDINATSSEKTFTATVNATGTYTVTATATDGSGNTKFESVEITTEGQSVSVELSYRLWLFKDGYQYENVTGGWGTTGYSISGYSLTEPTISTSGIKLATNGTRNGSWTGTQKAVDLSAIDRVEVSSVDIIDGFYLVINKTKTVLPDEAAASLYVTEPGSNSLDVSALSGSYYIALSCIGGSSNPKREATVESVELI